MALELRRGEGLTYADLADAPDDGHRYELIDGALVVTPSPNVRHQVAVVELAALLRAAAPEGVRVFTAPLDVKFSDSTVVEPDVLAVARPDLDAAYIADTPLLVVEVLSPSTRRIDVAAKRSVYEDFGVPSYWIVDPDAPSVTVLELRGGTHVEVAAGSGDETVNVQQPFPLSITPSALVY